MKISHFDWHGGKLTPETEITAHYKTTQNVRRFFKKELGEDFHFTREFLQWMKGNSGKTLGDAVTEWNSQQKSPINF